MKARLMLLGVMLIAMLMFLGGWLLNRQVPTDESGFVSAVSDFIVVLMLLPSPFLFLAALVIFIFSFNKAAANEKGGLSFSSNNLYWKLMKWFFKESWLESVSICSIFWRTMVVIFAFLILPLTVMAALMVIVLIGFLIMSSGIFLLGFSLTLTGILWLIALGLFILSLILLNIRPKYSFGAFVGFFAVGLIDVVLRIMEVYGYGLLSSVGIMLLFMVIFAILLAAVVSLLALCMYLYEKIPDNVKSLVCPLITESEARK